MTQRITFLTINYQSAPCKPVAASDVNPKEETLTFLRQFARSYPSDNQIISCH